MGDVVTIPRKEYEFLIKCKDILELERDKDFKPSFLRKLEKAEKDIKAGKGARFGTKEEVEEYLGSM